MSEFLRKYWFICLLGIFFLGALIYFAADLNKDNVSAKRADGQDVIATTSIGDVTASDIYEDSQSFSPTLLYNLYRNAVVDQAVKADGEMEKTAKTMARNIKANMDSDSTGATRASIVSELASYGFYGDNAAYNFAITNQKIQKLDLDFVKANFDKLKDSAPEGARTISILTMEVPNDQVLSDESEKKQEEVQKAIDEGKDFAEIAAEYSDDEATKENGGFFGYIDSQSTTLDESVVAAAVELEAGGVSDWISVAPENGSLYTLYRVYVNETDPQKIMDSENTEAAEAMAASMISTVSGLEVKAVENAAKDLEISFENEDVKKMVEDYIAQSTAMINSILGTDTEQKDDSSKQSSDSSQAAADSQESSQSEASEGGEDSENK